MLLEYKYGKRCIPVPPPPYPLPSYSPCAYRSSLPPSRLTGGWIDGWMEGRKSGVGLLADIGSPVVV